MFQGQYLFQGDNVYSPWMPRRADNLQVTVDVLAVNGGTLTIRVFHKNQEDTGDGGDADNTKSIVKSATGRGDQEWSGLKELVRYKFELTGSNDTDYVCFRMLDPVWFDSVKA